MENLDQYLDRLTFKSELGQDRAVIDALGIKYNGTFVDIGCSFPFYHNNTSIFESDFNWTGIAIDIENCVEGDKTWETHRPQTKHIVHDALTLDYFTIFKENNMPQTIDYLSLDLEPPDLTMQCLYKVPFNEYTFNVITFETDEYREGGKRREQESRKYLQDLGYNFIRCINRVDDVYVHSSYKK